MTHRIADAHMQKVQWGVWCSRSGGQLGPAQMWMKKDGAIWTGTEEEAITAAREAQESSNETFTTAVRRNPLTYVAREILS